MTDIITIKRQDQVEEEIKAKSSWVRSVLSSIGLPTDDWADPLSMDDLRRIRTELKSLDIDILDDTDGGIEIYYQGDLIAEFRRPQYILRENPRERDPRNRYYLEMHLKCRSVFDEQANKSQEDQ